MKWIVLFVLVIGCSTAAPDKDILETGFGCAVGQSVCGEYCTDNTTTVCCDMVSGITCDTGTKCCGLQDSFSCVPLTAKCCGGYGTFCIGGETCNDAGGCR